MVTEEMLETRLEAELAELGRLVALYADQETVGADARRWLDTRLLQQATRIAATRELLGAARHALPFAPRHYPGYERPEA